MGLEQHPPLAELDAAGRALLFGDAHTVYRFNGGSLSVEQLTGIWDLAKWGPTSANSQPLRVLFLRTPEARERLVPHTLPGNVAKVRSAAATALLCADLRFHEHMPRVMPLAPQFLEVFEQDVPRRLRHARDNAMLQAGYVILAVRAAGFAAGPFTGFEQDGVDTEFFPEGRCTVVAGVNIGWPDPTGAVLPRLPRLEDDEVLTFL